MNTTLNWLEGENGPWLLVSAAAASIWEGEQGEDQQRAFAASDECDEGVPAGVIAVGDAQALVLSDASAGFNMPTAWWRDGEDIVIVRQMMAEDDSAVHEAIRQITTKDTGITIEMGPEVLMLEAWETPDDVADEDKPERTLECTTGLYGVEAGTHMGEEAEVILLRLSPRN